MQSIEQFQQRVRAAAADKTPLRIRGGGTKDWYGQRLEGEILDTRAYAGVNDYEPTELVITARCGTPLAEIEAVLAERNQMLAFEPPHFGADATLGGAIAAGLAGPRRAASGGVRDFVLGAKLLDGKGDVLTFGGQVMKNVAGYDVSRLLAGSLGTLGLLLEVSVKVLPKPFAETTLCLELPQAEAIRKLNEWGGQPLPVSGSCWHNGLLLLRLSGAQAAVDAAVRLIGGEDALWRLSLPSTTDSLNLGGVQLLEWGGAQRWLRSDLDAATIRRSVSAVGGHATLFRGGNKSVGVFQPLQPAVARIHERLKHSFDPAHIFNPGRMF